MAQSIRVLEMKPQNKGIIRALDTTNEQKARKLMALGILPGMPLTVVQRFPAWVLRVGNTQVALDDDCASCITVELPE